MERLNPTHSHPARVPTVRRPWAASGRAGSVAWHRVERENMRGVGRTLALVALALAMISCGESAVAPDPQPDPQPDPPADVKVTSATVQNRGVVGGVQTYRLTATLENRGGPGFWRMEVWALRTSPSGSHHHLGTTEQYEVAAGWGETGAWDVSPHAPRWLVVQVRDPGSIQWRENQRYDVP
jgi:hypothetical protein